MVRKTQEALKRSHHWTLTRYPGDTRLVSFSSQGWILCQNRVKCVLIPQATMSRLISFPSTLCILSGLCEIFLRGPNRVAWGSYIQSLIWYIHHFHRWEGITSVRRTWCVDVICLCEKVHLLLMINVWNCLTERSPALLSDWSVSVNVSVLWSECICCTVRECTHSIKAVTLYACVCMCYTGYLIECMQNSAACLRWVFTFLAPVRALTAVLKLTVLTRTCRQYHNESMSISVTDDLWVTVHLIQESRMWKQV